MSRGYEFLISRIKDERRFRDTNVSVKDKMWLWRNGFTSGHKAIYGLTKENIHLYLDNTRYRKMHPLNGLYSNLLDNKAFLPFFCPHVCNIYVVIDRGIERYRKGLPDGDLITLLKNYIEETKNDIICKPLSDTLGIGFKRLDINNVEDYYKEIINNKGSIIINERVVQDDFSDKIFSQSVNTIRFMLYRDVETRKICVESAFYRFGTSKSQPIDNPFTGGLIVSINIESGKLGKPYAFRNNRFIEQQNNHPDSNSVIAGVQIPDWDIKLKLILDYFNNLSWFEYGGPDIVLTKRGFIVLEINSCPLFQRAQMERPYLADERMRKFFHSKGLKIR
jgi:hypothetical protein